MTAPVALRRAGGTAGLALLSAGLATGVYAFAAGEPHVRDWFGHLRVFAEALLCAGVVRLALIWPTGRVRRSFLPAAVAIGVPMVSLAVLGDTVSPRPLASDAMSLVLGAGHGGSLLATALVVAFDLLTTRSAVVRLRASIVALGTVAGLLVTMVLMATAGVFGNPAVSGPRAISPADLHWAGMAVLAAPLGLGWTAVRHDLFALGVMLRRAIICVLVVAVVAMMHCATSAVGGWMASDRGWRLHLAATLALLNLMVLLVIATTPQRIRAAVDRMFLRKGYEADAVLFRLSQLLTSARAIDDVIARTLQVLTETVSCSWSAVFLRREGLRFRQSGRPKHPEMELLLPADLAGRLERGDVLTRYEWGDGRRLTTLFSDRLHAELLIPVFSDNRLAAILVLGAKRARHAYTVYDVAFLRRVANQMVLAMNNAAAFDQLERLNANLEQQVRERTAAIDIANAELSRSNDELNRSNTELSRSLAQLRQTYQQLEQNQTSLLKADRLATLGRLSAGIAHEMNSPLSATLNSLKILADLGREYAAAIDDPDIVPEDHHAIANEIITTVQAAREWTHEAIGFIRSVKTQPREGSAAERFPVSAVVAETQALLIHRLRVANCQIDFQEEPERISVVGNPARLAQVLVNLVSNAIDAYEETGINGGRIMVRVEQTDATIRLEVHDQAGGIPPHVLPHIFEELFTTKEPGRGTGLGLWIARNIVKESFHGTLDVFTTRGVGSCFTATFPAAAGDAGLPAAAATASLPVPEAIAAQLAAPVASLQDLQAGDAEHFKVSAVIEETCTFLADRLRAASCQVEFEEESEGVTMAGDATEFRRILVSLVTNAIAAYEAAEVSDRRVALCVRRTHGAVTVTVRNWAGGLPLHLLPHIFDNTFDPADATSGVAEGLWMARGIIEHSFGGILDVLTATGGGTTFLAIFPVDAGSEESAVTVPNEPLPVPVSEEAMAAVDAS